MRACSSLTRTLALAPHTSLMVASAMATAADTVIAEAEEIVEIGEIEPENVRTYGVFVDYVVEGGKL